MLSNIIYAKLQKKHNLGNQCSQLSRSLCTCVYIIYYVICIC